MHNEGDAIARVDGYVISVAGAGSKVGKRMKIRIERATRTSAYAVLTSARPLERPVEAADLAELEVEIKPRPRRRPPAKKNVEEALPEADPEESAEPEPAAVEAPAAGGAEERPVAPRRKTRRGSRGGRGRTKKKVVEGVAPEVVVEAPPEPEQEPDASAEAEPPSPKTDDAAERPKRKTRRGSRGGRNRRRRTPVADGAKGADAPVTAFAAEEEPG
jgi:ribonuclease G